MAHEALEDYKEKTDRYLALFLPVQLMNQVAEAMMSSLEGRPLNKLLIYESNKYA
jgi:hypothetical protein